MKPRRIKIVKYGEVLDSVVVEEYNEPELKVGEVGIRMIAAPIHPSDVGVIMGTYGRLPKLPIVGGREGVGEVYKVGKDVDEKWLGKRVRMPVAAGSWQDCCVSKEDELFEIPINIPEEMAAMAFINPPTAWRLLHDFVNLKPGAIIIQNGGNSAVGICIIQMAKYFGWKTISIVRDEKWIHVLKEMGADEVYVKGSHWVEKLMGNHRPVLAINSIGGESAIDLIKVLEEGGTHVTIGGMRRGKVSFPTRFLIFKDIRMRGFWMDRWARNNSGKELNELYRKIFELIEKRIISIPVQRKFRLDEFGEAIEGAGAYHRDGKILFESHWR